MPNLWDQRFAVEGYQYGTAPNAFLTEQAHQQTALLYPLEMLTEDSRAAGRGLGPGMPHHAE